MSERNSTARLDKLNEVNGIGLGDITTLGTLLDRLSGTATLGIGTHVVPVEVLRTISLSVPSMRDLHIDLRIVQGALYAVASKTSIRIVSLS